MENPFEDVKREYVNRFRETRGILVADSYDSFVERVLTAIMTALNETDIGQRTMDELLGTALRAHMAPEQWSRCKADLLVVLFWIVMSECRPLCHEMAHHLYTELRKENHHEQI